MRTIFSGLSAGVCHGAILGRMTASSRHCRRASLRSTRSNRFSPRPSPALVAEMEAVDGDLVILGVAGKMGPTLARLAKNAAPSRRVIGVARFSDAAVQPAPRRLGRRDDRLRPARPRRRSPACRDAPNLIFAAGHKFGASGTPALTWAMNTWVPSARRRALHGRRGSSPSRPATSIR